MFTLSLNPRWCIPSQNTEKAAREPSQPIPVPGAPPPEASPHPLAPAFAIGVGVEGRLLSKEGAHSEMFLLLPSGLAPFFPVPQNKGVFSANLSPQRLNGSSGGSFMLWDGSISKETEKRVYFPQG